MSSPPSSASDADEPSTDLLDVGFVPAECPGAEGTGATRTSSLLIRNLADRVDLTVYVASQMTAEPAALPARDRVEYVLHDDLPKLPHPTLAKIDALEAETDAMEDHDLVHAYASAFVPLLADLSVPTLSTLNSYLPVCPKGDMLYHDGTKCDGPSAGKCVACIARADVDRERGLVDSLRAAYSSYGKLGFVRESLDRADDLTAYHAISPHVRDDYDDLGFPGDRITVVPHFYEEAFYTPHDYRRLDDGDPLVGDPSLVGGEITLLYAGALKESKGAEVLVRALPRLQARGYDVRLRVAGSGSYLEQLQAVAREHDVDDAIDWLGYVDHADLLREYLGADVFVYPGLLDEPFGRVLLEALETRTPVLCSDVGSMDYIVGDGGVLFDPGNEAALADGFERLVDDYRRHYDAIPDHVEQFAPGTVVESFLDLYESVAARDDDAGRPEIDAGPIA